MTLFDLVIEGKPYRVEVERHGAHTARVVVNGDAYEVDIAQLPPPSPAEPTPTRPAPARPAPNRSAHRSAAAAPPPPADGAICAPMPGLILTVLVSEGDLVEANQVLARLEAMKMENDVVAPARGRVTAVRVGPGDDVSHGQALFDITPE